MLLTKRGTTVSHSEAKKNEKGCEVREEALYPVCLLLSLRCYFKERSRLCYFFCYRGAEKRQEADEPDSKPDKGEMVCMSRLSSLSQ